MNDKHNYTDERSTQILIALLKAHGIRKVIANPGTTNISFVGSIQNDPWFEVYSGVDERHSAYLACGLSYESREPVVLSCTGATASRNYLPAMTEAYYRKLPILAITFTHPFNGIGQLVPQVIDRSVSPNDTVVGKFEIRTIRTNADAKYCGNRINAAILALTARGGGPVHLNIEESGVMTFTTRELPYVQKVERYSWENYETMPELPRDGKIAVFLSSGYVPDVWEPFIRSHNAIVFASEECDYSGSNRVYASLLASQKGFRNNPKYSHLKPDLIIDAGEISGDYPGFGCLCDCAPVWRVSQDGELRDRFHRLECLFDMPASRFVERYSGESVSATFSFYQDWMEADAKLRVNIPELPFSNPWIAKVTSERIPENAIIHFGILNSLRSWNLFPIRQRIKTSCNVGGFGIDGGISTLIGAALASPDKLHFGVFGDLAFFYDLNSLGNRHIGKNLRIILINNGCGSEFNMYFHPGSQFKNHTNDFIAAGGHFGNKSERLVKNYVQDLGFIYLSARNKEEYASVIETFINAEQTAPMVLECFTNSEDESEAHARINTIDPFGDVGSTKEFLKSMVPGRVKNAFRELIK